MKPKYARNDVVVFWHTRELPYPIEGDGKPPDDYCGTNRRSVAQNARGRRLLQVNSNDKTAFLSDFVELIEETPRSEFRYRLHHEPCGRRVRVGRYWNWLKIAMLGSVKGGFGAPAKIMPVPKGLLNLIERGRWGRS